MGGGRIRDYDHHIRRRGKSCVIAYAETMALAKKLGEGRGVMGSDCLVEPVDAVVFEDRAGKAWAVDRNSLSAFYVESEERKKERRAERKQQLLRQLSEEDLEILGVKP